MKIIFVRHGHPNYRKDCLTELGHLQAAAAADRLEHEGIEQIFSSSCGRALETAEYTARKIGISNIVPCDFMREISWGSIDDVELPFGGHPWNTSEYLVSIGQSLLDTDWQTSEHFCNNIVAKLVDEKMQAFDALLSTFGYQREGLYYRVTENSDKTIAVFSHAGSSSTILGHLFNLPIPFAWAAMPPQVTSVTIVTLSGENGTLITPKLELFNDAKHLENVDESATTVKAPTERVYS